jgi:hypothetical protein
MKHIVEAEAMLDYLSCPKKFQVVHLEQRKLPPIPEGTRARRSRHFSECMKSLLMFFLFRSMSGQPVPVSTLLSRWGKSFLKEYDVITLLQESHEVSTYHHNTISMNTMGVESILSFYDQFVRENTTVLEVMRQGILVLPSANRLRVSTHYVRTRRRKQPEVVYLYTGLTKPSLRTYVWPLLAAGMLYQQDYGVRPSLILSCPVESAGGREFQLPWAESLVTRFEEIVQMMMSSQYYLPNYAGNCTGCVVGGACEFYGWRGMT